ncbi:MULTISPECIES: hypothetical protein [Pseudomonas]|uniref:Uncharacterized protein n=1 Tax=Pseudomonas fluorescens TaxID=294 RepID=A0A5E6TBA5_PSEFL|nr:MULTISPECIES: hypothetical protein [Pseudomonas]VVM90639.1 hypothetical protein PS652_02765 [Pseudomonas fluorescens]
MLQRLGVVLLLAGLLIAPARADMAPWYRWESQADGRLVCSQFSPGPGWKQFAGPFNNAGCRDN